MKLSDITGNFTKSKNLIRVKGILLTGMNGGLSMIFSLVISLIIVRNYGALLWGDFLRLFLWLNIAAQVTAFGSKEFLLRKLSAESSESEQILQSSISARLPIVIIISLLIFAVPFFGITRAMFMITWLLFRFIYQSYEAIIIWKKRFALSFIIESAAGILLIAVFEFRNENISTLVLLQWFAFAEIIKSLLVVLLNIREIKFRLNFILDFTQLKESSFIFLIGIAGILHSRTNQLMATNFLPSQQLAYYQILMSMLLMSQSVAYFILQPLVKNLYSLNEASINKIALQLLVAGSLISPVLILMIAYILNNFFHFFINATMIISGYIFIVPFFYCIAYVYSLYKMKAEKQVLSLNIVIILLNLLLLPFIFPEYGISGGLIFAAVLQLVQAIAFRILAGRAF